MSETWISYAEEEVPSVLVGTIVDFFRYRYKDEGVPHPNPTSGRSVSDSGYQIVITREIDGPITGEEESELKERVEAIRDQYFRNFGFSGEPIEVSVSVHLKPDLRLAPEP